MENHHEVAMKLCAFCEAMENENITSRELADALENVVVDNADFVLNNFGMRLNLEIAINAINIIQNRLTLKLNDESNK